MASNEQINTALNIPINKGNYSMDSEEREKLFHQNLSQGWSQGYQEYRRQWKLRPAQQDAGEFPLLVDIEMSSICNLRCPMCYTITDEFKEKVNVKLIDWDLFQKIVDEISGKVPALRLSLRGESLLHPDFIKAVKYAKDKGIKEVSTLTNGAKLTPKYAEKLIQAGIDWITISVDGLNQAYEEIRKPIKFETILNHIKYISIYKKQNNLSKPVLKVQSIWPAIKDNPQEYYDVFSPYADLVAFNPLIDYLSNDQNIQYIENFCCPQQYQRLVIGSDGLVMKCSNDEENSEVIGDLNYQTVFQVWHSEKMESIRIQQQSPQGFMASEVCRKCYLPRQTEDEISSVNGRPLIVKNYTERSQVVGS